MRCCKYSKKSTDTNCLCVSRLMTWSMFPFQENKNTCRDAIEPLASHNDRLITPIISIAFRSLYSSAAKNTIGPQSVLFKKTGPWCCPLNYSQITSYYFESVTPWFTLQKNKAGFLMRFFSHNSERLIGLVRWISFKAELTGLGKYSKVLLCACIGYF